MTLRTNLNDSTETASESGDWSRAELLAMLAHDIRNSTQGIISWAYLVCQHSVSDETKSQGLEAIRRSGWLQSRLIKRFIELSREDTGNLGSDDCRIQLRPILEGVVRTMTPQALAKGINLRVEFERSAATVFGDPAQLEEIFTNLLSNAIKFTPAGGRIDVQFMCGKGKAQINVSDTGRGISAEFLPHVFERYRREKEDPIGNEGLGLGLAIVQYLVEKHGGNICAFSEGENKGATFTVSLPLAAKALSGTPR